MSKRPFNSNGADDPSRRRKLCSSCMQFGHLRRSHQSCPENPRNKQTLTNSIANRSDDLPSDAQSSANESVPQCVSCGQIGHSRRTNLACPLNSRNVSATACASCGLSGHTGSSSMQCPNNERNNPVEVNPVQVNPVQVNPVEVNPVEVNPVEDNPVQVNPVEVNPVEVSPVEDNPVQVNNISNHSNDAVDSDSDVEICSDCGMPGHSDSSYSRCPRNAESSTTTRRRPRRANAANNTSNIAKDPARLPQERDDRGLMDVQCSGCGAMMWMLERIQHSTNSNPKFQLCCANGSFRLKPITPTPPVLANLLCTSTVQSREFKNNSRSYNTALSFVSMGVKKTKKINNQNNDQNNNQNQNANQPDNISPTDIGQEGLDRETSGGVYTFKLHGSAYHLIGSGQPAAGERPTFSQIYIYDADNELENRHSHVSHVNSATLGELQALMHEINPYVSHYKYMSTIANEMAAEQQQENVGIHGLPNVKLIFRADGTPDRRRYNRPTNSDEVGLIIIGGENDSQETASFRDIVIHHQHQPGMQSINEFNQHHDPLAYALIFPHGDAGWHINMSRNQTLSEDYMSPSSSPTMIASLNSVAITNDSGVATPISSGSRGRKISPMDYYCYRLMVREPFTHYLHMYGKMFHQYIVISFDKMEKERLGFICRNQVQLRADMYRGLRDAVALTDVAQPAADASSAGKKVILPSSFLGGPRYMAQLYHDALSIVRRFGKPDYFITFTCNPSWPEIQRHLKFGQAANDRPDLTVRIFNLKLKELMYDLTKRHVLGKMKGFVYTIEFQKRGLPHAHILLIVEEEDKPRTAADIDHIVSAELPDQHTQPLLWETVTKNMLHGPCGFAPFEKAPCMDNGKCSKKYPKKNFSEETVLGEGYPEYRRRDDGRTFAKVMRGAHRVFSNKNVVPYNPYLTTKYNAHINVEICSSINSIKYVYKYVYKGHDRISGSIETDSADEVKEYIDARYVSAPEACWRLMSFRLHQEYPFHQRLAVHLEDQQTVLFGQNDNLAAVVERASDQKTTLTAWFVINRTDPDARTIMYPNFPEHYVWDLYSNPRAWKPRKKMHGSIIGRVYNVSPKESEKYHLRMLLYQVAGATSFANLRTVNDVLQPTFKAACQELGLLESDDHWESCLAEAATIQSPYALRALFCVILYHGNPANPFQLWTRFCNAMSEDYVHRMRQNELLIGMDIEARAKEHCLFDLDEQLQDDYQVTLTSYDASNFVLPANDTRSYDTRVPRVSSVFREHHRLIAAAQSRTDVIDPNNFNVDQRAVYDAITHAYQSGQPNDLGSKVFFIDGPGGTGKTYLFNSLLHHVRSNGGIAIAVASSGTAALLIDGGRTSHSAFSIPLEINEDSMCAIKPHSEQGRLLRRCKLIVWDESSMTRKDHIDAIDRTFRDVLCVDDESCGNQPFGGMLMVFGGDFRQILPVIRTEARPGVVAQCINRSRLWRFVKVFPLRVNMRVLSAQNMNNTTLANELQAFATYLLNVGDGNIDGFHFRGSNSAPAADTDYIPMTSKMMIPGNNIYTLIAHTLPLLGTEVDLLSRAWSDMLSHSVLMTPLNADVKILNNIMLQQVPGNEVAYRSVDRGLTDISQVQYPVEILNNIEVGGLPSHILKLKVHSPIMLLRNLSPASGLCNGTRLIVRNLLPNVIHARIISGSKVGKDVLIPRINLNSPEESPIEFQRLQFPVRLAFAMSINKSQGQTLRNVGLYLPKPVFSHGQLYVALSRVQSPSNVKILIDQSEDEMQQQIPSNYTRNVVFNEALSSTQ